ncbi:hypothetical protein RB623_21460 [Mesorhizobium sp. LHD-90]|uniref:hypothetical protein n=1 Tax=Mesorhizobium sp. LHD-90 TaxID=3071414 RepID=UPI0027E07BFA|nr:hypothetical protein [Mesorhizobium sp. LHD-90]MDQ6436625.1 hypothetical protein [Mesorhizobium sp. LHD-90]
MAASTKEQNLAGARAWAAAHFAEDADIEAAQHLIMDLSGRLTQARTNPQTMMTALTTLIANFIWNTATTPKLGDKLLGDFGEDIADELAKLYASEGPLTELEAAVPQLVEDMINEGYFSGERLEDVVAKALLHRTEDELTTSEHELYEEKILPVLKARFEKSKDWKKVYRMLRTAA